MVRILYILQNWDILDEEAFIREDLKRYQTEATFRDNTGDGFRSSVRKDILERDKKISRRKIQDEFRSLKRLDSIKAASQSHLPRAGKKTTQQPPWGLISRTSSKGDFLPRTESSGGVISRAGSEGGAVGQAKAGPAKKLSFFGFGKAAVEDPRLDGEAHNLHGREGIHRKELHDEVLSLVEEQERRRKEV